jgi:enoyl-CoA hydratase
MPLLVETADGVRTLTLNRPERRNALSGALLEALLGAFAEVEREPELRAVHLTAAGTTFCAGGDLSDAFQNADGFLAGHLGREAFARLLLTIRKCRVPVVCSVQGDAMGGGFGLAAACDLVIADPAARLGTPEIDRGLFPWIILAVLLRDIPRKPLFELVFLGGKLDAARAAELSVINRVSAPGSSIAEGRAVALAIATKPPALVSLAKRAFHRADELHFEDALAYLAPHLSLNLLTEDAAEGLQAFLQKRTPVWKGR